MLIENETKTRKIEFTRIESIKEHHPSHKIKIGIATENIKIDFNNSTWISEADIEKFLIKLDELNISRKVDATLESMSPGEMTLTFTPTDNLGHLSVSLRFVKEDKVNRDHSFDVKVDFQIDPTSLTSVRNGTLKWLE